MSNTEYVELGDATSYLLVERDRLLVRRGKLSRAADSNLVSDRWNTRYMCEVVHEIITSAIESDNGRRSFHFDDRFAGEIVVRDDVIEFLAWKLPGGQLTMEISRAELETQLEWLQGLIEVYAAERAVEEADYERHRELESRIEELRPEYPAMFGWSGGEKGWWDRHSESITGREMSIPIIDEQIEHLDARRAELLAELDELPAQREELLLRKEQHLALLPELREQLAELEREFEAVA